MVKKFIIKLLIGIFIMNSFMVFFSIDIHADYILEWYNVSEMFELQSGDNWFQIQLLDDEGYNNNDIYFEITTLHSYSGLYVELYYGNKNNLIAVESRDYISNYCLSYRNARTGWYYINIYTRDGAEATITADKFGASGGTYEPNNRFNFATEIELGIIDTIISDRLGTNDYNNDVDIYKYTAFEPCMITIDFDDYSEYQPEISVYVGNNIVGSTSRDEFQTADQRISSLPYSFNHTHGPCYIKVFGGSGAYKLKITQKEYSAKPILYIINPKVRQLYSQFDVITPKLAILGNGDVTVSYLHVRDGNTYSGNNEKVSVTTNNKTFVECQFNDILPTHIDNYGTKTQNDVQFFAVYGNWKKNAGELAAVLAFDNDLLFNKDNNIISNEDIIITTHKDGIEVEISAIKEKKHLQMPQRPYRYRIYPANSMPCEYTEWMTQKYYGIEFAEEKQLVTGTEYIVEVQIRDKVAENSEIDSNNANEHIITLIQTIVIG